MPKKTTKIIIGLVGEIASGKDSVADYLTKKHNAQKVSFSKPIREALVHFYLPQTRENMMKIGTELRKAFGQDLISKVVAEEAKQSKIKLIVLPNIRLESDLAAFKNEPGFVLVAIDVDAKIRYQRLTQRTQNPDDQTKTWAQFQKDQKLYTETHIKALAKRAKYHLDNNGSERELYRQVEELLKKLK